MGGSSELVLREVNGWPVGFLGGDGAPRVADVEVCLRSGYGDIYKFRQRIREFAAEDEARAKATGRPRKFNPLGLSTDPVESGGRPGTVFWLNEHEAVFLMTQIKTPVAREVTHEVIDVFVMARHGALPPQAAVHSDRDNELDRAKVITRIVELMSPAVSQESKDAALAHGLRLLTGQRLADVLPTLPGGKWYRPSEIAKHAGVSEQLVGRRITKLELRGKEPHSRTILDKKPGADVADVPCYIYDEHAKDLILKDLEEDPPKPSKQKKARHAA